MSLKTCQADPSKTCIPISKITTGEDYFVLDEQLESNLDAIDADSGMSADALIHKDLESSTLYLEIDNALLNDVNYRASLEQKIPLISRRLAAPLNGEINEDEVITSSIPELEIFFRKHGLIPPSVLNPKDETTENYFQVTVPADKGYALAAMDLTKDAQGNDQSSGIVTIISRDEINKTVTLEITINDESENDPAYHKQIEAISSKATELFRGLLPTKQPIVTQVQKRKHTEEVTKEYFPGLYGAFDNLDARYQKSEIRIALKLSKESYVAIKSADNHKSTFIQDLAIQSDPKYTSASFSLNLPNLLDQKNYDQYKTDAYIYAKKSLENVKLFLVEKNILAADSDIDDITISKLPYAFQNYVNLLKSIDNHYSTDELQITMLSPFRKSIVSQLLDIQSDIMTNSRLGTGFFDALPMDDVKSRDQLVSLKVDVIRLKNDASYRKHFMSFANQSLWLLEDTLYKNDATLDEISLVKADFLVNLHQFKELADQFEYEASRKAILAPYSFAPYMSAQPKAEDVETLPREIIVTPAILTPQKTPPPVGDSAPSGKVQVKDER